MANYKYRSGWRARLFGANKAVRDIPRMEGHADSNGNMIVSEYSFEDSSNEGLGKFFRENFFGENQPGFIAEMDDETLGAFLKNSYLGKDLDRGYNSLDLDEAYLDIQNLLNSNYMVNNSPDYAQILQNAESVINAENAEVEAMYNQLLAQQTEGFQNQLADNNKAYNDVARQILSNNYMQNSQLMGGLQTQMDRSSRNALEAGASAGLRLAGNVNTLLSVQNQQASKSLETSNQLAQMLLNQRQAAAGIRGDYMNAQAQNTANRANLRKGNAERVNSYANSQFDTQQRVYDQQQQAYNEAFDSKFANNAFADAYKTYKKGQTYNNKYGY